MSNPNLSYSFRGLYAYRISVFKKQMEKDKSSWVGGSNREREECTSLPKMCHSLYNTMLIILPNANAIKVSILHPESIPFPTTGQKTLQTGWSFFRMTHFNIPLNWRVPSEVSNNFFHKLLSDVWNEILF